MARTKSKNKRNIWADIVAVILLAAWAYFADFIIDGIAMPIIEYPLIGSMIAGVVPVNKVWVFILGALFYFLTSAMGSSRFIGWLSSMAVMTEIMIAGPLEKFKAVFEVFRKAKTAAISQTGMAEQGLGLFPWKSDESWIRALTYIAGALFAVLLVYFIVIMIKDRKAKRTTRRSIRNTLIFIAIIAVFTFIPGLIMDIGPQWMFICQMTLITWIDYMYGTIKRSNKETPVIAAAVTIVLLLALGFLDLCYRIGFTAMLA